MKTRERILGAALSLFNQQGSAAVSTNHIAEAAGISPGNLYYHFHNKEEIICAICEHLFTRWDTAFALPTDQAPTLATLQQLVRENFTIMADYGFVYRELITLLQQNPELQQRWSAIRQRGFSGFQALVGSFAAAGVLRIPNDSALINRLAELCWLISEFWLPSIEVRGERVDSHQINQGVELMMQVFQPYIAI